MQHPKKALAAGIAALALSLPLAPSAQAAPITLTPPPSSTVMTPQAIAGYRLSVVQGRWGLYHGKATNLRTGGTEYYGPGRFRSSDAWKDVQSWYDGL